MRSAEIRQKYLEFFEKQGHKITPSAPLVPDNDPTTLFTGSGMQPLLPYLLGQKHPLGTRIVDSQKSFRSQDIEEVGDNRHTTFFEMLGNWSFGDYWKKEQLGWFFEFLTKEVGISKDKLWVTCFEGEEKLGLPKDTESAEIWKSLGVSDDHIKFYGPKKNWWSRAGVPENMPVGEPGGPDSEVFYEFTHIAHDTKFGAVCHPNCDCGRFMEIGNSVFMQYIKQEDGSFALLPQRNVDFGGGLERISAAFLDNPDVFKIDLFDNLRNEIEKSSGKTYGEGTEFTRAFRIVMDHIRSAVFLIGDGVTPSNTDQGYVLRRLLRRAIRFSDTLGVRSGHFASFAKGVIETYGNDYKNLREKQDYIAQEIMREEEKFRETLERGLKEFNSLKGESLSGSDIATLYQTYGFPFEVIKEISDERGLKLDEDGFKQEMEKHRALSRAGSEKKFKGGLAGHSDIEVKYHTATHLLHQALRTVLGDHVYQKGSNITPERLRFDFSHSQKMTDEEKKKVEDLINQKIKESLPVHREEVSNEEARKRGAIGLFGEQYGDVVSIYRIGDEAHGTFSLEFCGGPHVTNTSELGHFKIVKEEAVSAGVRRIKAVLE